MLVRTLCAALLLMLWAASADAQINRIRTGKVPGYLFSEPAAGRVHVLTAGVDRNFNGVMELDSGDVPPRWEVIDAQSEVVVDSLIFPGFFNSWPIRPGVDLKNKLLYLPQLGRVRSFNIGTMALERDTVILGSYVAATCDTVNNRLLLSMRPGFSDPGYVLTLAMPSGDTLAQVPTAVNAGMSIGVPTPDGMEYYTIAEGGFSTPSAAVAYSRLNVNLYETANGTGMGGGASYLAVKGDRAFVALGGGQKLHVLDTRTGKDVSYSPVSFGEPRQNGPRTLAFQDDDVVLVGTYNGEVIRVRIADGTVMDTIQIRGKIESMAVRDSLLFVAVRLPLSGNGVDSVLQVADLRTGQVVNTITLGPEPIAVFVAGNGDIHVLSNGRPSVDSTKYWWVLDATTLTVKSTRTFTGQLNNPFRFVYDQGSDTLYAIVSDVLKGASINGSTVDWTTLYAPGGLSGRMVGVSGAGEYLVTYESGTGGTPIAEYAHVVDRQGRLVAKFRTGARPIMAARVAGSRPGAVSLYVIGRGAASQQKSALDMFEFTPNITGSTALGSTANHLVHANGSLYVTMNAGHDVVRIDPETWAIANRASVGTSGFDGPREALVLEGSVPYVIVTTYAGDVRAMGPVGAPYVLPLGGKMEGITRQGEKLFVASAFAPDYTPDSAVVVLRLSSLAVSITRENGAASAATLEQNVPNPASSSTTLRFMLASPERAVLTLHSADGRLVETMIDERMEAGTYAVTLNTGSLPSGTYLYTLRAGSVTSTRTMQVVR